MPNQYDISWVQKRQRVPQHVHETSSRPEGDERDGGTA